jgi:hypothetical protein
MIASVVELVLALTCLGLAGLILIGVLDRQRESGRRDD